MARLLAHGAESALSGEHHRGATSAEPGIVVRSVSTDNATDGHEETVHGDIAVNSVLSPEIMSCRGHARHSKNVPESRSRSKHELAQGPHNTVRAGTVLEDRHGSFDPSALRAS